MTNYETMTLEALKDELEKNEELLTDARDERAFLGMQTGQHIKMAEFNRLDQDIERFEGRITLLSSLIAARAA